MLSGSSSLVIPLLSLFLVRGLGGEKKGGVGFRTKYSGHGFDPGAPPPSSLPILFSPFGMDETSALHAVPNVEYLMLKERCDLILASVMLDKER